jgi:hypothetical protein
MSTEADSVRVRLKEEEERIVTWRAELDEEKRRILSTQEVLLRLQSEQESKCKELKEEEVCIN